MAELGHNQLYCVRNPSPTFLSLFLKRRSTTIANESGTHSRNFYKKLLASTSWCMFLCLEWQKLFGGLQVTIHAHVRRARFLFKSTCINFLERVRHSNAPDTRSKNLCNSTCTRNAHADYQVASFTRVFYLHRPKFTALNRTQLYSAQDMYKNLHKNLTRETRASFSRVLYKFLEGVSGT